MPAREMSCDGLSRALSMAATVGWLAASSVAAGAAAAMATPIAATSARTRKDVGEITDYPKDGWKPGMALRSLPPPAALLNVSLHLQEISFVPESVRFS